ncbi:MAG: hypothetical protein ACOC21_02960 [Halanaerobiales bacterium]
MKQAMTAVPGSCGELAQGRLNNKDFLISCPINRYSQVRVVLDEDIAGIEASGDYSKTIDAVELLLEYFDLKDMGARLYVKSELLRGKGMASSTADISAALAAVFRALNQQIDHKIISKIALAIEPTDAIFFPGITYFDHLQGKSFQNLGYPPPLQIIIFAEPCEISTMEFNNNPRLLNLKDKKEAEIEGAVKLISQGLQDKNPRLIGQGATISARAHQIIYYRPYLDKLLALIDGLKDVYGVNIAHSGSLLGILVDCEAAHQQLINLISNEIEDIYYLDTVKLISGGVNSDEVRAWG